MCNIRYDYQKDDHGEVALKKVIDAIRGQGVRVYNFQANVKGASAELDLDFLTYAMEQRNLSSTSRTFTFGAPSFTGVADFAQHLRTSLDEKTPVQLAGKGVALRALLGARIDTITAAENIDKVCGELSRIQTGYWDEPRFIATFHNVQDVARANLLATERSELEKYQLVVVSFTEANVALPDEPKEDPEEAARSQQQMVDDYNLLLRLDMAAPPGGHKPVTSVPSTKLAPDVEYLKYAWAMCPKAAMHSSVFVAREGLNGTLVLAKQRSKACSVISYLTGVDKMSGAYLLPIDLEGKLAIPLRSPQRPDIQVAAKGSFYANRNRKCVGRFLLGKIESLAF
jgi:hypothetical protein